ncbi:MAG: OsmC family protein [Candidatus Hydrogenedentes bacterium]|nr:OsmC family protein [Candidatus Hydrogenedentota bacterium]
MAVEIDVTYDGNLYCTATHGPSRKTLQTEAPVDNGGKGESFSPTDLLATATGACMLTVMGIVAAREGVDMTGAKVHVIKEMTSVPTRRVGKLTITLTMPEGLQATDAQRTKLERAAEVCPVKKSLHPDVELDVKFVYP